MDSVPACDRGNGEEAPDEAFLRLERALYWQAAGPRPWKAWGWSFLWHVLSVALVFLLGAVTVEPLSTAKNVAVPLFAPLPSTEPPAQEPSAASLAQGRPAPLIEPPAGPLPELPLDVDKDGVSFAVDVRNQLPDVVREQRGKLALLEKGETSITSYILEPPEWEPQAAVMDVSASLKIQMDPPEAWPVVRDAARRSGIALERYNAYAIFGPAYRGCLQDAIRRRAQARGLLASSRVGARLIFAVGSPCGVEVQEVFLANNPAAQR